MSASEQTSPPKYTWPWYVLAAVIAFFLLAAVWMAREVSRIKRIKAETTSQQGPAQPPATHDSNRLSQPGPAGR